MSPITRLFVDAPLETRVWALVNQWGESGIFAAFPVKAGLAPLRRWGGGCLRSSSRLKNFHEMFGLTVTVPVTPGGYDRDRDAMRRSAFEKRRHRAVSVIGAQLVQF
jgi:hypothetical protein